MYAKGEGKESRREGVKGLIKMRKEKVGARRWNVVLG